MVKPFLCGIESVVLFCFLENELVRQKPIEIWVMHEYFDQGHKISQSWTKQLSINIQEGIYKYKFPTIFLNSEELLIKVNQERFFSYNIRTSQIRSIHKGKLSWCQAFDYVKSLVSINGNTLDK